MTTLGLLKGLRFIDSLFPSGGFAFSSGLEAAVKDGAVRDGKELMRYVEDLLVHGLGRREAVVVAVAHQAGKVGKLTMAVTVDQDLDELKIGRDSRLASRQMGWQVIKVSAEQIHDNRLLRDFRTAIEVGRTPGHFPVSMGMTLAACGWLRQDTVAATSIKRRKDSSLRR